MKPLIILLSIFIISLTVTKLCTGAFACLLSGRIAMSIMLGFTAAGHFAFTKGMSLMLPRIIPFKKQLIYFTGLIEVAAAIGLLVPRYQQVTAWLLTLFFMLILPANINAALKHIDYQKGTYEGPGKSYLWFRVPLQAFFIGWTYWFALRGSN